MFTSLVPIKTNPVLNNTNWPIGAKHVDLYKESYRKYGQLDPLWSFSYSERNGEFGLDPPLGKTVEPWKVLVIYSTEPDLHPDCDLELHKNQKITGGSHGWRHMQFRLLGMTFGIAPESFRMHMNLAETAFEIGNDYWGWWYLSRCAHYLADLGNPFHVKALPASFLIKKLFHHMNFSRQFPPCIRVMRSMSNAGFARVSRLSNRPYCAGPTKGRPRDMM